MFTHVHKRPLPNVLITGTPGTGKSTLAEMLVEALNDSVTAPVQFQHVPVSQIAIEKGMVEEEFDAERNTHVLDEDSVLDYMEDTMLIDTRGGCIVEYHSSDWFPERWFDLVVVLRTEIEFLVKRLDRRGYSESKVRENTECEIMQVCLDEALESYKKEIVWELPSNGSVDLDANVERIVEFVKQFVSKSQGGR